MSYFRQRFTLRSRFGAWNSFLLWSSLALAGVSGSSQNFNSWVKPSSGNWQDQTGWSLGNLPAVNQDILFTNAGWKAVSVGADTAQNFPQSMNVGSITVSSPQDSYNVLLLNYAGYGTALQAGSVTINTNAVLTVLGSMLSVTNSGTTNDQLLLDGTVNQGDNSAVRATYLGLGTVGGNIAGVYNLTNGLLTVHSAFAGGPGQINQFGGYFWADQLELFVGGYYYLYDGDFGGDLFLNGGNFIQLGGLFNASLEENGFYTLAGGTFIGGLSVPGAVIGYFTQTGGTNQSPTLNVGAPGATGGIYTLSNGLVTANSALLGDNGKLDQWGGTLSVDGPFRFTGEFYSQSYFAEGELKVHGGNFSARSLDFSGGAVDQSGGNAQIGDLNVYGFHSSYTLDAGLLTATNLTVTNANSAWFAQNAGTNTVAGLLKVSRQTLAGDGYKMNGGALIAPFIRLDSGGVFHHTGGDILNNQKLTIASGTWEAKQGSTYLGQLELSGATASPFLTMPAGASVVGFAASTSITWPGTAPMHIQNWAGSLTGGGQHQVTFGPNGLTAQQVRQIYFDNPAGLPAGTYPAHILATGEVVPDQGSPTPGVVNSWINPASGNWDQAANWSLGVLPNSSQTVFITNSGWKAVAINSSTAANFPDSMTVTNLTIRGAWDTENVLLLNYVGTDVPLTVLNGLTLQDMAQIVNFNSGLVVEGGTITVTNAQIMQDGGFIRTTNATMYLQNAEYDLTNGVFEAGTVNLGLPVFSRINQYGGAAVISDLRFGEGPTGAGGQYALYGGYLSLPGGLSLVGGGGARASYFQSGGSNQTTQVYLEPNIYGGSIGFTLNGGLLADSSVWGNADDFGSITLNQNGGTHIITNRLFLTGASTHGLSADPATYNLNNGTLSAGQIELNADQGDSVFIQSNGTATAGTLYAHSVGYYGKNITAITLAGGTLSCSNYTTVDGGGTLTQSGGALIVSSLLDFGGFRDLGPGYSVYARYTFTGGNLSVSNINISEFFVGDGSTPRISNPGYFSLSHRLVISNAVEQLGRFILAGDATLDLAGSASRLSFANSSAETWAGAGALLVADWNGNPTGGGAEQLIFGTNESGLTPAQLNQIWFRISTNLYSAKILNTGEVVPDQVVPPPLVSSRQGDKLVLGWLPGYYLQTATNVAGPYVNVPGTILMSYATPPYTNDMTLDPQRFFRLAQ